MTKLELSMKEDFAALSEHHEPVVLRRRDLSGVTKIDKAYRQSNKVAVDSGKGKALHADAVWHLQLPEDAAPAQPGDVVVDSQKQQWTLLEVQLLPHLGRCKCVTRDLRIAHGCSDLVDIERAIWDDIGNGPEITDWFYVCRALPAKIQLDEMLLDSTTTPPTKQLLFSIVLSESAPLEPDDRIIAEDGATYRVQSVQQPDRLDALPVASAICEEGG